MVTIIPLEWGCDLGGVSVFVFVITDMCTGLLSGLVADIVDNALLEARDFFGAEVSVGFSAETGTTAPTCWRLCGACLWSVFVIVASVVLDVACRSCNSPPGELSCSLSILPDKMH